MKFLILLALVSIGCAQNPIRVKMDIYYGSLCVDTFNFIQQLNAVYPQFRQHLDITFIPFGKASVSSRAFLKNPFN